MIKVLLAGESWISNSTHYKGFDAFTSVTFHTGNGPLTAALEGSEIELTFMPAHEVPEKFPSEMSTLNQFDVIILSDIGANSLSLPQETWLSAKRHPDRLQLLKEWTLAGGGLVMMGGYLSFQGIEGKAFYAGSAVESVLPVEISRFDDRVERPAGVHPTLTNESALGLDLSSLSGSSWPHLLGYNKVSVKPDAEVLAEVDGDPLLVVAESGKGRCAVWTSDISPHWCPVEFSDWSGYRTIFTSLLTWLSESSTGLEATHGRETSNA